MTAIAIITAIYGTLLAVAAVSLWRGLSAAAKTNYPLPDALPPVTVIVAAHNEEKNLPALLHALEQQHYPRGLLTVLIADDRSSDDTPQILAGYKPAELRVRSLRIDAVEPGISPKKHALQHAIEAAETDILLFTDADCIPGPEWVRSMAQAIEGADAVIGASPVQPAASSFTERYSQYETARTIFFMHGAAGLHRPYMAVGRNWAYRKSLFNECGGFEGLMHTLGGDDDLLLQRFAAHRGTIRSVLHPESWVMTVPPSSLAALFRQKRRHYSASKHYAVLPAVFLGGIQFLEWVCIVCTVFGIFTLPFPMNVVPLGVLLALIAIQMIAVYRNTSLLRISAFCAPFWEFIHLLFSTISGVAGLFRSSSW